MAFEKTRELASSHTEEEVNEEDLKEEEDTSTDIGQSDKNETEPEEDTSLKDDSPEEDSVETLKERLTKTEQERDNYRKGMLTAKAKTRALEEPVKKEEEDVTDERILSVLYKSVEKRVLRDVIDSSSEHYMPELVDDTQYNEIVSYLPRSIDRSSETSIRKALKTAVAAWKFDRGIKDVKKEEGKKEADLAAESSTVADQGEGKTKPSKKPEERKLLKKTASVENWY